ncbi:protein of unknown function [Moritella yayanosii]|uniref:Uncharacterized protein n=1 Tax=Moritella yayanosii TaxID=69539 RepID=A0A330LQ38_9GAMM|nr:protein of unknown function [Moritella yayanosii]
MVKKIIMRMRLTLKPWKELFEGGNDVVDHKNTGLGSWFYQVGTMLTMITLLQCLKVTLITLEQLI